MPSAEPEVEQPSNVTAKRQPGKRKREIPASRLASNKSSRTSTSNAYARRSPPREPEPRPIEDEDDDGSRTPPQKLKRPGAGARLNAASKEAAELARKKREEEARAAVAGRQTSGVDVVASHYNAVPERGREWRKTDSQIKGLRSLNNWIKSTLIQKFSRPEIMPQHGLTVLDMACGKGGDLGKWEKAPVVPALYVGCDIADVSVDQAKQRYNESMRKNQGRHRRGPPMRAEFYVKDSFGTSLGDIPIVRQVGFNPQAGPASGIIQGGMMGGGGFDVVSMMFALHYSFESEALARGMLQNVAGALKKGGRFIGVMPNSDVITATVKKLLHDGSGSTINGKVASLEPARPTETEDGDDDDWDPEKPSEPVQIDENAQQPDPAATNGTGHDDDEEDDWDPEKPSEPANALTFETETDQQPKPEHESKTPGPSAEELALPPLQWGNSIYSVRFPRAQPLTQRALPRDGIFRPAFGWKYHYSLEEAVDTPEYVVPWEAFRALAEDYGLELMYRKGFREVFEDESTDRELGMLAERMGVMSRARDEGKGGLLVSDEEMEAASFYHAFCFYKT